MAGFVLLAAFAASASPQPVPTVTVLGAGPARYCYEAARLPLRPRQDDLRICDRALGEQALARRDLVATHVNRGILRIRAGDEAGGMSDFNSALAIDPTQPEAHLNKGVALLRSGTADAALLSFSRALELATRRPELAYYGRGIANEALGNVEQAYLDYRRATELAPQWVEPHTELQRFRVEPR